MLLDANMSERCTIACRVLEPALDVATLGPVDAVLISHAHRDHLDLPTLEHLTQISHVIVPLGADVYFKGDAWSRTAIDTLEAGECQQVAGLEVCAVPAQHNGNRDHPFRSRIHALGYVIRAVAEPSDAIYYAGDTGATVSFEDVRERYHPRLAILPIGAWRHSVR